MCVDEQGYIHTDGCGCKLDKEIVINVGEDVDTNVCKDKKILKTTSEQV